MTPKSARISVLAGALALALPMLASAQIKVGVTVASTGPAASLGIPERNTVSLLPTEIAGQKIEYIVLDDATDTTVAVKNMRKLISEDKVDVVVGTSVTPGSLAMIDVAGETQTPMISVAANARIVQPVEGARQWVFKTPQNDQLMAAALADAMVKQGVKTLGFIGYNDAYGVIAAHAVVANQAIHDGLVECVAHVQRAGDIGRGKLDDERLAGAATLRLNVLATPEVAPALPFGIPAAFNVLGFEAFGELFRGVLCGISGHGYAESSCGPACLLRAVVPAGRSWH